MAINTMTESKTHSMGPGLEPVDMQCYCTSQEPLQGVVNDTDYCAEGARALVVRLPCGTTSLITVPPSADVAAVKQLVAAQILLPEDDFWIPQLVRITRASEFEEFQQLDVRFRLRGGSEKGPSGRSVRPRPATATAARAAADIAMSAPKGAIDGKRTTKKPLIEEQAAKPKPPSGRSIRRAREIDPIRTVAAAAAPGAAATSATGFDGAAHGLQKITEFVQTMQMNTSMPMDPLAALLHFIANLNPLLRTPPSSPGSAMHRAQHPHQEAVSLSIRCHELLGATPPTFQGLTEDDVTERRIQMNKRDTLLQATISTLQINEEKKTRWIATAVAMATSIKELCSRPGTTEADFDATALNGATDDMASKLVTVVTTETGQQIARVYRNKTTSMDALKRARPDISVVVDLSSPDIQLTRTTSTPSHQEALLVSAQDPASHDFTDEHSENRVFCNCMIELKRLVSKSEMKYIQAVDTLGAAFVKKVLRQAAKMAQGLGLTQSQDPEGLFKLVSQYVSNFAEPGTAVTQEQVAEACSDTNEDPDTPLLEPGSSEFMGLDSIGPLGVAMNHSDGRKVVLMSAYALARQCRHCPSIESALEMRQFFCVIRLPLFSSGVMRLDRNGTCVYTLTHKDLDLRVNMHAVYALAFLRYSTNHFATWLVNTFPCDVTAAAGVAVQGPPPSKDDETQDHQRKPHSDGAGGPDSGDRPGAAGPAAGGSRAAAPQGSVSGTRNRTHTIAEQAQRMLRCTTPTTREAFELAAGYIGAVEVEACLSVNVAACSVVAVVRLDGKRAVLKVQTATTRECAASEVDAYKRLAGSDCTLTPMATRVWQLSGGLWAGMCLLPFVDGWHLVLLARWRPRDNKELLQMWRHCAKTVGLAHERGQPILDLKRDCFVWDGDKHRVMVLDLNSAVWLPEKQHWYRQAYTSRYIDPQAEAPKSEEDAFRADVYSLGVVFAEMAMGDLGDVNIRDIGWTLFRRGVPREMCQLIQKMVGPRASQPPSANAVKGLLRTLNDVSRPVVPRPVVRSSMPAVRALNENADVSGSASGKLLSGVVQSVRPALSDLTQQ